MSKTLKIAGTLGLASVASFAILAIGQGLWGLMAMANLKLSPALPWAPLVMWAVLAALVAWLGGAGWPKASAQTRRRLLRWNPMPWPVFRQAIFAGVLALVALGGLWITVSDLVHIPPGLTPSSKGIPIWSAILFLMTASAAAPLSEEAAFRGYAQGLFERAFGSAALAILASSVLFALAHLIQGVDVFKLGLYFTAGLIFGTIAWATNSLYAAMVVHSLGDVMGFTLLWPHDRPHVLVTEGGHDPLFVPAVAALVIFTPLAVWAFARLAARTRGLRAPAARMALAA
jgi:membrane protease YdiL (CAAX protease family)